MSDAQQLWPNIRVQSPVVSLRTLRDVWRLHPYRRRWSGLALATLGDWLALLACAALAARLAPGGYAAQTLAAAGVPLLRLLSLTVLTRPVSLLAQRLDTRWRAPVVDTVRAGLLFSVPLVWSLWWTLTAVLLVSAVGLGRPAASHSVTGPPARTAAQLDRITQYVAVPAAAALLALLTLIAQALAVTTGAFRNSPPDLALYLAAAVLAAAVGLALARPDTAGCPPAPGPAWRLPGQRVPRALLTATTAGLAVVGLALGTGHRLATDLGGGDAGYALLVTAVTTGVLLGAVTGPRVLRQLTQRRLLALALVGAGAPLLLAGLVPDLAVVVMAGAVAGWAGGIGWITGYTLLDADTAGSRPAARGWSLALLTVAVAATAGTSALVGRHEFRLLGGSVSYTGAYLALAGTGLALAGLGWFTHRRVRAGGGLRAELAVAVRGQAPLLGRSVTTGYFLALEGCEGAGKSTQAKLLASWLRDKGHEAVVTREPGATTLGRQLRETLLDVRTKGLTVRAEALLYAGDRAQHVAETIRPALERGAVVVTDRYLDSSVAYQGAGRELAAEEIAQLSRWATDGLLPDLTVVLDVAPDTGLARSSDPADRIESEPLEFHRRVRAGYLALARSQPERYLVVDASASPAEIFERITAHLADRLPLSPREETERAEAERRREEERRRRAEEERRRVREERLLTEEKNRLAAEQRRLERERRKTETARRREEEQRLRKEAREAEQARRSEARTARLAAERAHAEEQLRLAEEERKAAERAELEAKARAVVELAEPGQGQQALAELAERESAAARPAEPEPENSDRPARPAGPEARKRTGRDAPPARRGAGSQLLTDAPTDAMEPVDSGTRDGETQLIPRHSAGGETEQLDPVGSDAGQTRVLPVIPADGGLPDELLGPWPISYQDTDEKDRPERKL